MNLHNPLWQFYRYKPSVAAATVFIALFLLLTAIHSTQLLRWRTWYFLPFLVGGFLEWMGYIGRIISSYETPNWTLVPYTWQALLLLLAPAFFSASIYMTLGRIILMVDGEGLALLSRRYLTKVFVTGDIVFLVLQAIGGGIMSHGTLHTLSLGSTIIVIGISIQILFFSIFLYLTLLFHHRLTRQPTLSSLSTPWLKHIRALYAASALILLRSAVRVAEYRQSNDGWIMRREWVLYVADALPMLGVMLLFAIVHPSEVVLATRKRGAKREVHTSSTMTTATTTQENISVNYLGVSAPQQAGEGGERADEV
ncbi:MAG: hypothetical protein M1824_005205 [Vezdaea acicularis]|nr:MAG: hypothetical protein M1824_005205 [Vezdaea acicularis]